MAPGYLPGKMMSPRDLESDDGVSSSVLEAPAGANPGQPDHAPGGHEDPISPVLVGMLVIILAARLGGHLFETIGQPAVLGELIVGVIIGNLTLAGYHGLDFLRVNYDPLRPVIVHNPAEFAGFTIDALARIGVILLLFQVGLETSLADFRRVGLSAMLVAVLGVIAPMFLGWGASSILLPKAHWTVHMFVGATLCATSVGITARVLRDLGKSTTREAQIILGAAVIDDVLGLIVLAVAQGIIISLGSAATGGAAFGMKELALICVKAFGFLLGSLVLGRYVSRSMFKAASYLKGNGLLLVTALAFCFGMSWLASAVGLAPIVGAFAAGLILEHVQYRELSERDGNHNLEELIKPLSDLLVPVFFVMMGIQVSLTSFMNVNVLGLAAVLIVVAVIGKQVCFYGVLEPGLDRRSVGLGMIPRGEVGLIFAAIGRQLKMNGQPVISVDTYSALVVMVIVTTVVTPPLLKWSLAAYDRKKELLANPLATAPAPDTTNIF